MRQQQPGVHQVERTGGWLLDADVMPQHLKRGTVGRHPRRVDVAGHHPTG
jgi:hypothetical protein